MNFWAGFVVGTVIMSIFACVAIIASDNDHPILTTIFLGPVQLFIVVLDICIRHILIIVY